MRAPQASGIPQPKTRAARPARIRILGSCVIVLTGPTFLLSVDRPDEITRVIGREGELKWVGWMGRSR